MPAQNKNNDFTIFKLSSACNIEIYAIDICNHLTKFKYNPLCFNKMINEAQLIHA